MNPQVHEVDAFTSKGRGGNPAGVCLRSDGLGAVEMQAIAARVGFSETAFVGRHPEADRAIRFFTPTSEVGLCGHATIASWHRLLELGEVGPGTFSMWTKAGVQEIRCDETGLVAMSQNRPEFGQILDPNSVAPCLGLDASDFMNPNTLPIQVASTGLHKIFAPIRDLDRLQRIRPDLDAIARLSRTVGAIGIYCLTLDSLEGGIAQCRNFAPVVGIEEDAATGTSAAATACLLYHHGVVDQQQASDLVFEQGYAIERPSRIRVRLHVDGPEITRVWVAGHATTRNAIEWENTG